MADCATCICHVIHKDGNTVLNVAHQDHPVHLVGLLTLFVDERKLHVEAIGNGGHPEDKWPDEA